MPVIPNKKGGQRDQEKTPVINIVIIGGNKGGTTLVELLHEDPNTNILGVADENRVAPAMILARRLKIPTTTYYAKLLSLPKLNFVIDTTGSKEIRSDLARCLPESVELISGPAARFMWHHLIQRVKRKETLEEMLFQYQSIYDLGLKLTANQNLARILFYTLEDATRLTNTHAGAVTLYDERKNQIYFGAAKGFSKGLSRKTRWKVQKGGLTSMILNSREPVIVSDVHQLSSFDNPMMLNEGVRSLMASPLIAEGRIVGILYVSDFVVRKFTPREIGLLSLASGMAANIIDKAKMLETAMLSSITDDLTGLYNHRYFTQCLANEVGRAERYRLNFVLVMIDIDDFKLYNDTHGHPKGNVVLRQVAGILRDHCRAIDVIARFGGEEFSIIMPETTSEKVFPVIDRLRKEVSLFPFEGRERQPGGCVTISMGVATYPANGDELRLLIERADAALYEAKRHKKNCVVVSDIPAAGKEKMPDSGHRGIKR